MSKHQFMTFTFHTDNQFLFLCQNLFQASNSYYCTKHSLIKRFHTKNNTFRDFVLHKLGNIQFQQINQKKISYIQEKHINFLFLYLMKNQFTLLQNCYFQFCQDYSPSVIGSQYHTKEPLAVPVKRERISLKRNSDSNPCLMRAARPLKYKAQEEELTRTETEKIENLKFLNMQTMSSTYRPDQERPQKSDRIIPTNSTRSQMGQNEQNTMNILSQFESQQKLHSYRSGKEKNMSLKPQNMRSQPFFVRKALNFQQMVAKVPILQSQVRTPVTITKQTSKKGSKYQLNQSNGHKRTVTIYSIESQTGVKQRIEQSMIEIDFFHPSTRRLLDLEKEGSRTGERGQGTSMNNA